MSFFINFCSVLLLNSLILRKYVAIMRYLVYFSKNRGACRVIKQFPHITQQ